MIRNYLVTAFRNIWKRKVHSFINLLGLSIGMASFIVIVAWVSNEVSFDQFHTSADRIYRLCLEADLGTHLKAPVTNGPAGPAIVERYPEVLAAVRLTSPEDVAIKYEDRQFTEENVTFCDKNFFEVFSFPLLQGNPTKVLEAAYTVVIAESIVPKYFADEDPIGKILTIGGTDYAVTGIMADFPQNSQIHYNVIRSFETMAKLNPLRVEEWMSFSMGTYLLLAENTDAANLEAKLPDLVDANLGPIMRAIGGTMKFWLQPMTDVHLHSDMSIDMDNNGNITYVYLFSGVALLVLLMACFNFINLSTALASLRAKEVGIRKTLGADRRQLVIQFISESIILSLLAIVMTIFLLEIFSGEIQALSSFTMDLPFFTIWWLGPALIGLAIMVGLLAGAYPAFYLSAFEPNEILGSRIKRGSGNSRLRQVLVVFQFSITIMLLIGTTTITRQIKFINTKPMGFSRNNILFVSDLDQPGIPPITLLRDELNRVPGVDFASICSHLPGVGVRKSIFLPEGFAQDDAQTMDLLSIDTEFLDALEIQLATGRNFSSDLASDSTGSCIINATAAQSFGWEDPIGKKFYFNNMPDDDEEPYTASVIGVIQDFHMASLHEKIEPLFIGMDSEQWRTLTLKLNPLNTSGTLQQLQEKWQSLVPERPFDYIFLDDRLKEVYQQEQELQKLASSFSLLAIFIGCLGLFGMSSFTATNRTKEIGIRKVLGASVSTIVRLLSVETTVLILLSSLIAYPVAWYAMNIWLDTYAFRISFNWLVPLLITAGTLLLSIITVSYQSIKVALANPIKSLRYE